MARAYCNSLEEPEPCCYRVQGFVALPNRKKQGDDDGTAAVASGSVLAILVFAFATFGSVFWVKRKEKKDKREMLKKQQSRTSFGDDGGFLDEFYEKWKAARTAKTDSMATLPTDIDDLTKLSESPHVYIVRMDSKAAFPDNRELHEKQTYRRKDGSSHVDDKKREPHHHNDDQQKQYQMQKKQENEHCIDFGALLLLPQIQPNLSPEAYAAMYLQAFGRQTSTAQLSAQMDSEHVGRPSDATVNDKPDMNERPIMLESNDELNEPPSVPIVDIHHHDETSVAEETPQTVDTQREIIPDSPSDVCISSEPAQFIQPVPPPSLPPPEHSQMRLKRAPRRDPPAVNEPTRRRGKISFSTRHVVITAYDPEQPDELLLRVGDEIIVQRMFSDGWAQAFNVATGQQGAVPLSFLTLVEDPRDKLTQWTR
jgi:hypothetical protein